MALIAHKLDTDEAGSKYGWFAAQDALRRNSNNKSRYTQEQIRRVISTLDLLDYAYSFDEAFINYRIKFMAIKLDNARIKDRKMLNEVESLLESYGVEKAITPTSIIYRFLKP
jgi:hypothetical protein